VVSTWASESSGSGRMAGIIVPQIMFILSPDLSVCLSLWMGVWQVAPDV